MEKRAYVTDIQRFCVHDGPGIRTTVFYQGCPLKCKWCQNPETISLKPVILYNKELCVSCKACVSTCPNNALSCTQEGDIITDKTFCNACGKCEEECYFLARKLSSHIKTVDEVFDEVIKDEVVYKNSGGGLTISGGEPLRNFEFNYELLRRVREKNISTAVETCGLVPTSTITKMSKVVDLFLFDFKMYTQVRHKEWTGHSNTQILQNLRTLVKIHNNIVIRIPLIPNVNDTTEEFTNMMRFLKDMDGIDQIHILPFHQFGSEKYNLLDLEYELIDLIEENQKNVNKCVNIAQEINLYVNVGGTSYK
ncbi:MAG: hypothetical protein BEN19_03590 [Epulopiscium sp. Nuni2H_MBin003]|nr:MAG: hypothetical protein BEN19_03590 [Epulopiscium sp. Nuni2H_MBin003]